jgi:hypothetical protein
MKWYIRACPTCGGDLHDSDERGWAECLMCSRSFRPTGLQKRPPTDNAVAVVQLRRPDRTTERDRGHPARRAA